MAKKKHKVYIVESEFFPFLLRRYEIYMERVNDQTGLYPTFEDMEKWVINFINQKRRDGSPPFISEKKEFE